MAASVWDIFYLVPLVLMVIQTCNSEGLKPTHHIMNTLCGEVFDMEYENITSGTMNFTGWSRNSWMSDCRVAILAPPDHRVVLRILNMEFVDRFICSDYVDILDGIDNGTDFDNGTNLYNITALIPRQFGDHTPNITLSSTGREVSVHFHSDGCNENGHFRVLFTSFHTGICEPDEFKCNNGYCIDGRLRCNGYNNCGDETDLCFDVLVIVIFLGAMFVIICFIVVVVRFVIRRHHRVQFHKGGYIIKTREQETIAMNAPSQPYGQSHPINIPTQNSTGTHVAQPKPVSPSAQSHAQASRRYPSAPPPSQGSRHSAKDLPSPKGYQQSSYQGFPQGEEGTVNGHRSHSQRPETPPYLFELTG